MSLDEGHVNQQDEETGSRKRRAKDRPEPRADTPSGRGENIKQAGNAAIARLMQGADAGQALPPATRHQMEEAFGRHFGHVRVHRDRDAAEATEALDASALTHGADIHVGSGAPPVESPAGKQLIAHELAHVVQQEAAGGAASEVVSRPGDSQEVAADRAASAAVSGQHAEVAGPGVAAAVQRQEKKPGETEGGVLTAPREPLTQESATETAVQAFLNRCWHQQSRGEKPLKMTESVRDGLKLVFNSSPAGPSVIQTEMGMEFDTPSDLMKRIRPKLPTTVDATVIDLLNKLPGPEKKQEKIEGPAPAKGDEALEAAFKEAVRRLIETKPAQELLLKAKEFALSKEGIPLIAIVTLAGVAFVAANDPRLPGLPEFDLGHGLKIKIEYSGRASDIGPLIEQMGGKQMPTPAAGTPETKVGLTVTLNTDQIGEFFAAAGRFFETVGKGIAAGAVAVGTFIAKTTAKVVSALPPEVKAMVAGAAAGALIGLAAGGGIGAAIGAAIGAGVGLIGALTVRLIKFITEKKKPE